MTTPTEKFLFIAMDDEGRAHPQWCGDRAAVRVAVRDSMFMPGDLLREHEEQINGVTDELLENGSMSFEGDPGLFLYRVPVAAATTFEDWVQNEYGLTIKAAARASFGVDALRKAFELGQSSASIDASRWTPVSEGMPTESGWYLAMLKPDNDWGLMSDTALQVEFDAYKSKPKAFTCFYDWKSDEDITAAVTHWMPMPAALGAAPVAPAAAAQAPITGYDVGTSAGGVGYLVEYFATRLRTHTYQRYIEERLAKDFACTLAKHLSERDAAQPAPFQCAAGRQGTTGGNTQPDCDWPGCGCDEAAMKVIDALQESGQLCMTVAQQDVIRERQAQYTREGFMPARDDYYVDGELVGAAVCYAIHSPSDDPATMSIHWPRNWAHAWWKPTTPRRNLVKAAALLLAEIERLDRQAAKWPKPMKDADENIGDESHHSHLNGGSL